MTGAKFTPGPWRVQRAQTPPHRLMIYGKGGGAVGCLFERDPLLQNDEVAQANAHLIEQAPVLKELLAIALDEYEQHNGRRAVGPHWSVEARDILDRAEGRLP